MNNSSHSGDEQLPIQQDLVAYLDGELDDEGARRVEGLLSSDADAREEMHKLEVAWDLLEELPREEVGQSFTHTTVEMIALSAEGTVSSEQKAWSRKQGGRLALAGASLLVAAASGFLAVSLVWPNPNRSLLRDLPLLEDLDAYRQVETIDFIRQLKQSGLFDDVQESEHAL